MLLQPKTRRVLLQLAIPTVLCLPAAPARAQALNINSATTLTVSDAESGPVLRAMQDLSSDFNKVFGREPTRVTRLEDAGPLTLLIGQQDHLPASAGCAHVNGKEAFAFSAPPPSRPGAPQVLCLSGADMRGTLYAIYQFSQKVLGVDPMYLWTDNEPARRTSITLPADFAHIYPSPVFTYRGFFINDEDLLSGWRPAAPGEHTGISLQVWDNVFETILRLKGNMVVPGSWIFPDDAQVNAAARRGLIINQHHATPLGVNFARWPKGVPFNYSTHPEYLENAWRNAVASYDPKDEIVWSVGLRGLSDQPYAELDPSVRGNDKLLGERISQAIADQVSIVKARFPDAHFIANLWMEGDRLKRAGYLQFPPEVTQVWADTGYGDLQDGGRVAPGEGMYFHVAMMNYEANQLSEMVPVSVIQEELGRYIQAGATKFFLVNTSDIRPVAMTARAVMETAWGGAPKQLEGADTAYYRKWSTQEFGATAADAVAAVYRSYFAAPIPRTDYEEWQHGQQPSRIPREYGEQHYYTAARRLLLDTLSEHDSAGMRQQTPKWEPPYLAQPLMGEERQKLLRQYIQECEAAQPRWDAVWQQAVTAEESVTPDRRPYYGAHVLTMIALNREGNRMLLHLAKSLQSAGASQTVAAAAEAAKALQALDTAQKAMSDAEYGKWKNWFRGDWLTGVYRTDELMTAYAAHLRDPMARLPAPLDWTGWEAYFHIMEYEGDREVDVSGR